MQIFELPFLCANYNKYGIINLRYLFASDDIRHCDVVFDCWPFFIHIYFYFSAHFLSLNKNGSRDDIRTCEDKIGEMESGGHSKLFTER